MQNNFKKYRNKENGEIVEALFLPNSLNGKIRILKERDMIDKRAESAQLFWLMTVDYLVQTMSARLLLGSKEFGEQYNQ